MSNDKNQIKITLAGNPMTLQGNIPDIGTEAPNFQVVDNDLNPVQLKDFHGNILLLSSVPSLDTPVCDVETRRFNREAANLGDNVKILTISMDLPFAQKRWCGSAGIDKVKTLSDHKDADFGLNYGVLIKELRLLARTVFILDQQRIIRYIQVVPEVTNEPDYDEALQALKNI